jgi:hypothetical protein
VLSPLAALATIAYRRLAVSDSNFASVSLAQGQLEFWINFGRILDRHGCIRVCGRINILFKHVYVGIFDDLDWDDEATHFALLTKKIDRYTQYIRSGQLLAGYPEVRGYGIVFEYVATRPMTPSAARFWKTREQIIRTSGFEVRSRTVDVRPALLAEESCNISAAAPDAAVSSRPEPAPTLPASLPAKADESAAGPALLALRQVASL